jgi:hypothetical protein
VQAVIKRLKSQQGYTLDEAARTLKVSVARIKEKIREGAARVTRAPWDQRRLYLSRPMLARLRSALRAKSPAAKPLSDAWLTLTAAAALAGVSTSTINQWANEGSLHTQPTTKGRRYARRQVMRQALEYWATSRFKRDGRPAWLIAESARREARAAPTAKR